MTIGISFKNIKTTGRVDLIYYQPDKFYSWDYFNNLHLDTVISCALITDAVKEPKRLDHVDIKKKRAVSENLSFIEISTRDDLRCHFASASMIYTLYLKYYSLDISDFYNKSKKMLVRF